MVGRLPSPSVEVKMLEMSCRSSSSKVERLAEDTLTLIGGGTMSSGKLNRSGMSATLVASRRRRLQQKFSGMVSKASNDSQRATRSSLINYI